MRASRRQGYAAYVSIDDVKYFGITNVRVEDDKDWKPRVVPGFNLIKVTLVEDMENRLSEIKDRLNRVE